MQFFNFFNHPNFDQPNRNINNPGLFGRITTTVNTPTSIVGSLLGADASPTMIQLTARSAFSLLLSWQLEAFLTHGSPIEAGQRLSSRLAAFTASRSRFGGSTPNRFRIENLIDLREHCPRSWRSAEVCCEPKEHCDSAAEHAAGTSGREKTARARSSFPVPGITDATIRAST